MIERASEPGDDVLHRLVAVTDAALSHLDPDTLFHQLLVAVRDMLATDTAGILLLDRDANQLVATAAVGFENEVRQGFRLDIGTGFAGRVAATRAPVIIDRVDPTTVASAALRDTGITTLVGVPMLCGGDLVGVLHLGTVRPRQFTEHDLALLQLVADRAAQASRANQSLADRAATLALQRSLLPTRLPEVDGVDLSARYLPGHHFGVGGDWYDVFVLPSGNLGVVVGDVSGHGLRSAVVMGRLRSALRAYALVEDDPARVLTFLNRKIQHFEAGNLATLLYAIISPARDQMIVSVAGHLPPILGVPTATPRLLDLPADLPVGVVDDTPRRSTTVQLPPVCTIVFYTDGLVERRGEVLDDGVRRLCGIIEPGTAESVCAKVMAGMNVDSADDDIALLVITTHELPKGSAECE